MSELYHVCLNVNCMKWC